MLLNEMLLLGAVLFCIGVYGVLARRNGVLVLMSIELMLQAVNINLLAFSTYLIPRGETERHLGFIFAIFVITIAAAEVGLARPRGLRGRLRTPRAAGPLRTLPYSWWGPSCRRGHWVCLRPFLVSAQLPPARRRA